MAIPDRHKWRLLLVPFSWLYGSVVWFRNMLYDSGVFASAEFNIPLISVGNLAVGGTGKTPHVEYLADLLKEEFTVATLSRGYRRKTRDFRVASLHSTAEEIGDEPLQIKRKFPEITVAVDRDRRNGIRQLMKLTPPVEVILLDDAYQHRAIRPGLSILLMDYATPVTRDLLLPAGRLREPSANRNRADILLVTRSPGRLKPIERREYVKDLGLSIRQHLYFTSVRYGELLPVFDGSPAREISWFKNHVAAVLIVTGIARPRPVRQFARSISTKIREVRFPDHHRYRDRDLARIMEAYQALKSEIQSEADSSGQSEAGVKNSDGQRTDTGTRSEVLVLTTEKDATRLRAFLPPEPFRHAFHAVRIHIHFLNEDQQEFNKQIRNYVISNKRSSILYQAKDQ